MAAIVMTDKAAPAALRALVERYDPDAIDLPGGRARIQLVEEGGAARDAGRSRRG